MSDKKVDVLLVGGGVMSATLGMLLNRLAPQLTMLMVERLDDVARESSDGWNNAGTGHAGYCELNYTPQESNGSIDIKRALAINASFEVSLQFWASLVETAILPVPDTFINQTPHLSMVWGQADVDFLRQRHALLSAHHLFEDMQYSERAADLEAWMPLVMQGRDAGLPVASTRVAYGVDVDFGALTRHMIQSMQRQSTFELLLDSPVSTLRKQKNGRWLVQAGKQTIDAGFVFLGAGGGALPLLQKSGIAEGQGYGGFPVSGEWLVCNKPEIIQQHHAKVYGKAAIGAPPMSVPHLDTRVIDGKPALLFGPFAGFTTRFLKQGSLLDLVRSIKPGNLMAMLAVGRDNFDLTRYLVGETLQTHEQRMQSLRQFMPSASPENWTLASAGKRVQIIKQCGDQGGKLEFGTEVVAAADGSLAALLGASPGASVSVQTMINIMERCLGGTLGAGWQARLKQMVPSYGESLIENAGLLQNVRQRNLSVLGLQAEIAQ